MTEPFLEAENKRERVGLRRNMEDADLRSDTLSWRNRQNIQESVWGYLRICTPSERRLFKAFLKSELGTLPNNHIRLVKGESPLTAEDMKPRKI